MKKITLWLVRLPRFVPSLALVLFANIARAQQTQLVAPVTDQGDLAKVFCAIIGWFFWIVIVISVIMVLSAAFSYVTAGDNTEKTTRARRTLTYAAIGIAVALLAAGFPAIVSSIFPNEPGVSLSDTCPV